MHASPTWLTATGASFSPGLGRSGCAQLAHYTAQFCEWGEGPPLVVIPGLAGGYNLLGPLAKVLSTRYRVISYQLRGEEDPFVLRRPFDLQSLVSDLSEFLDSLYLENPTIFGVSFGGLLAAEFAARFPYRVDNLILQGIGATFQRTLLQRVAGTVLSRIPLPSDSPFINQFFNLLFAGDQKSQPLFRFVVRQCWKTDQSVMAHRFQLAEQFDIGPRLDQIQAPTLILAGDRDLLVSKSSLDKLHDGIEEADLVSLTGAGHLGFVTQPQKVGREVVRFLKSRQKTSLYFD